MALPTQEEQSVLHRYFGVEFNNAAWDLASRDRTADEDMKLLDLAHASKLHWDAVGTELHKIRGLSLVSHAHASVGLGDTALNMARQVTEYFAQHETEDWERAFVNMIHAQAAHAAGSTSEHAEYYAKAREIVDAMPEGEDKRIVMLTWVRIPTP